MKRKTTSVGVKGVLWLSVVNHSNKTYQRLFIIIKEVKRLQLRWKLVFFSNLKRIAYLTLITNRKGLKQFCRDFKSD